jgi:DNA-binding transcriptional regulator YiaG
MNQPEITTIAIAIDALCKRTQLSQADIARQLGVPPKTLNDWLPNANRNARTVCRHRLMLSLAVEALQARLIK